MRSGDQAILQEKIDELQNLRGLTCTQAHYGLRGLELIFDDAKMIRLGEFWRLDKSNKIKVGIGDMAKIMDDPDMSIFDEECDRLNNKLSALVGAKLKSIDVNYEQVSLILTKSLSVISHRLGKELHFWELSEKREDGFVRWVPIP